MPVEMDDVIRPSLFLGKVERRGKLLESRRTQNVELQRPPVGVVQSGYQRLATERNGTSSSAFGRQITRRMRTFSASDLGKRAGCAARWVRTKASADKASKVLQYRDYGSAPRGSSGFGNACRDLDPGGRQMGSASAHI